MSYLYNINFNYYLKAAIFSKWKPERSYGLDACNLCNELPHDRARKASGDFASGDYLFCNAEPRTVKIIFLNEQPRC